MKIKIYQIIEKTKMSGPGNRFSIWVQGCSRHCTGCMLPETWNPNGGILMETNDIFIKILQAQDIEGVTFLGGEPFEQALAVYTLASKIQTIGLTVTVFTGYTYEELAAKEEESDIKKLLSAIDLLIDGSYKKECFDISRPWIGSSNQRYHFLSDKYTGKDLEGIKNQIEVRISEDGKTRINGMGDFEKIKKLL